MTSISLPIQSINSHKQVQINPFSKLFSTSNPIQKPINTVGNIMDALVSVASRTGLLGVSNDAQPILLDLKKTNYGSILITSEPGFGKTHQLQVITESVLSRQYRYKIRVVILTNSPWEWQTQAERHQQIGCRIECHHWQADDTPELIRKLVEIVQLRQVDKRQARDILLVMDEIDMLAMLDEETRVFVNYLISCGALAQVRTIATLTVNPDIDFPLDTHPFKTHICGHHSKMGKKLIDDKPGIDPASLNPGEFAINIEGKSISYRLPMIGN